MNRDVASFQQFAPVGRLIDRLRRPDYTGANRCIPCTILNAVIAMVLAIALGYIGVLGGLSVESAVGVSLVTAVVMGGVIYLRGYLVPYTPTITKRYFPERVLRWFDKSAARPVAVTAGEELVDIEEVLLASGAVTECADLEDWCLDPGFEAAWHEHIAWLRSKDSPREETAELLTVDDPDRLTVRQYGAASVVKVDGAQVGQWESDAAFIADVAADKALTEWYAGWGDLDILNRSRILNSLRMFLNRCPACDGPVSIGQETVESCCRTLDVVAVSCESCGARVFEIEMNQELKQHV